MANFQQASLVHTLVLPLLLLAAMLFALPATAAFDTERGDDEDAEREYVAPAKYVIHISVDGLRADAITRQPASDLPNFYRFRSEGSYTDNARTDYDYSNTLPNHTSQLTGRPVAGLDGHNWTTNSDPEPGVTLHSNKGEYVASVFDVAHDNGLSTALYTSKSKFVIFDRSYDEVNGARDAIGADDGRDKIDEFVYEKNTDKLVQQFVRDMAEKPYDYAFLHLRDPDHAGHVFDFDTGRTNAYMRAIRHVDRMLGEVFELVDSHPELAGNTVILLTSDHGGGGNWHGHGDATHPENYTIPFYTWGRGVEATELYSLNTEGRVHPEMGRPAYDASDAPIRNGDAANLALSHLGLPPVPGSMINVAQDLSTGVMPTSEFHLADRGSVATQPANSDLQEEVD